MKKNPKVSIVIPAYNASNYINEAIDCALSQTYKNIEIIVVNDGSNDDGDTERICASYGNQIFYYYKNNGGCASALNYGISKATGDFISWLSHDDVYDVDKIERQVDIYNKYNLDAKRTIISSLGRLIDENGQAIYHPSNKDSGVYSPVESFEYLLFHRCFNGCGLLIPRVLFSEYGGFDETLRYVLDWNLWLKYSLYGVSFYLDNRIRVGNRCHSGQVTVLQRELHSIEAEKTVEDLFLIITSLQSESMKEIALKDLYYFAASTGKRCASQIRRFMKDNHIGINIIELIYHCLYRKVVRILKKIYHRFR